MSTYVVIGGCHPGTARPRRDGWLLAARVFLASQAGDLTILDKAGGTKGRVAPIPKVRTRIRVFTKGELE
jgi:hypothetical protein